MLGPISLLKVMDDYAHWWRELEFIMGSGWVIKIISKQASGVVWGDGEWPFFLFHSPPLASLWSLQIWSLSPHMKRLGEVWCPYAWFRLHVMHFMFGLAWVNPIWLELAQLFGLINLNLDYVLIMFIELFKVIICGWL